MTRKKSNAMTRLVLTVALSLATGCDVTRWEGSANGMLDIFVPEQHEQFSREYFEHVLAGDFAAADAMIETMSWCAADIRGTVNSAAAIRAGHEAECSAHAASLLPVLQQLPAEPPQEIRLSNYRSHYSDDRQEIRIEQEFIYAALVVRATMMYERSATVRRVTEMTMTLDDMTLAARITSVLDEIFGGMLRWMIALQIAAYLAVPLVVFWILRRQRRAQQSRDSASLQA